MIIQNHNKNIPPNGYTSGPKIKFQNGPKFSGARLPHQTFEKFEKFARRTNFSNSLKNIINESNFIDSGAINSVYKIPGNDIFVLRVKKKALLTDELNKKTPIEKAIDTFPNNNLGQKIANIGDSISVIIKQSGCANGINNWVEIFLNNKFSKEHLPEFIEKLKLAADIDQKGYKTLAEEMKLIHRQGYSFDYVNPRNILLDKEQQTLNIVDVEPTKKIRHKLFKSNNENYLLMSLLDQKHFMKALELSDASQKEEIILAAKKIKAKTKTASKQTSLKTNDFLMRTRLKIVDKLKGTKSFEGYVQFKNFLDSL